jgi:predicted DNA-binding transcriptional regulator AlpA
MTATDRPPSETGDRLLPWKQVKDITGLSRTTAWRLQKAGDFPAPLVISPGRVGWLAGDVAAWTASRTPRRSGDRRAAATPPPR